MYKLRKSLYGLKQALRAWSKRIVGFLIKEGFIKCVSKHVLYANDANKVTRIIIYLYVDDLLIAGSDGERIMKCNAKMMQEF